jgi:hypothetical protein
LGSVEGRSCSDKGRGFEDARSKETLAFWRHATSVDCCPQPQSITEDYQ